MTTIDGLLDLVVAAVSAPGATDADARVYRPGDWPTQSDQYPIWKVRVVGERKQSWGRSGAPNFTVTATIRAVGEVSAPVEANDAGAGAAEAALWRLKRQYEVAVINSRPLEQQIQQMVSVDSQLSYTSEAETHLAGVQIDIMIEFIQGAEDFAPVDADDLDLVAASLAADPTIGFVATSNS